MHKVLLLSAMTIAVAFAGCTDAPPSGSFTASDHAVNVEGSIDLAFQARVRNTDGTPLAGTPAEDNLCSPSGAPPNDYECVDPSTTAKAHIMSIPQPSTDGYMLYWTNDTDELLIGALVENGTGMYELAETLFTEDHSGFTTVELRMGSAVIATAMNAEGAQAFEANQMLIGGSASVEWEGKDLTATVTGLMGNVSYTGWLVSTDENGELVHDESFGIAGDGTYDFTAAMDVGDYKEFHIHITGSKVNVVMGTVF